MKRLITTILLIVVTTASHAAETLRLQHSQGLLEAVVIDLPQWPQTGGERHLGGHIAGLPQSWVRASLRANGSGVLSYSDGNGHYYQGQVQASQRLQITSSRPYNGGAHLYQDARGSHTDLLRAFANQRSQGYPPFGPVQLTLDLGADDAFVATYGDDWRFMLRAKLNLAAGIIANESGLELVPGSVDHISLAAFDQLPAGAFEQAAMALAEWRRAQLVIENRAPSLLHLISGHQKPRNRQEGISFDDVVCNSGGWDVGISTDGRDQAWVMAHEISHGLGASHDDEGSCATEQSLMAAWLLPGTSVGMSSCAVQSVTQRFGRSCIVKNNHSNVNQSLALRTSAASNRAVSAYRAPTTEAVQQGGGGTFGMYLLFAMLGLYALRSTAMRASVVKAAL